MPSRWDSFDPDAAAEAVGLREPHLVPIFPIGPLTPKSKCPHHCKRCSGTGRLRPPQVGPPAPCPQCKGTGKGPIPKGDPFVCACCDASGKDHLIQRARRIVTPRKSAPRPKPAAPDQTRRQRRQARISATPSPSC